jgi:tRNA(fMet)-specific endonuclease VapC
LILDTALLVAAERRRVELASLLRPEDDLAIAAITAAELLVGVELASEEHRERRRQYVEGVLGALVVEEYDLDVARAHARLLSHTKRTGRARGALDLIIAATALARGRRVRRSP